MQVCQAARPALLSRTVKIRRTCRWHRGQGTLNVLCPLYLSPMLHQLCLDTQPIGRAGPPCCLDAAAQAGRRQHHGYYEDVGGRNEGVLDGGCQMTSGVWKPGFWVQTPVGHGSCMWVNLSGPQLSSCCIHPKRMRVVLLVKSPSGCRLWRATFGEVGD